MISPRSRKRYQNKHNTYPAPTAPDVGYSSASWQQTQQSSGVHFENEPLDINGRASQYNPNYVSAGGANDQLLNPKLRRSHTMPDHLSPDASSFQISHTQSGNENFSDSPYSRAPFANMTSSGSPNFTNRDGQSAGNNHGNQVVSTGLAQHTSRQVFNSDEMLSQPTNLNLVSENRVSPHPDDRQLPPRDVTLETIEEAYVSFIMCCNPSVPLSTDSGELRRGFNSPPKSDGKTFQTFALFELIGKLERKELKTWAQLAIELGVEPPVLEKGQSAQKVQQYAVRLKRWMHAMHVDAFFEYLLSKPHVYWTQIPSIEDGASEFGRDGVPPEEDLALRALLPETRPKRGRRKAEDKDNEVEDSRSPAQRPRLNSPTLSEDFALARSAHPDHMRRYDDALSSPWSTEPGSSNTQNMRWRLDDSTANTPLSAHPQSAVVSRATNPFLTPDNEPRSAITPTTTRSRRRHGPAVSSAWPSSSNNSSGKLRGRPPSNRSITDGPFSTFPANPNTKVGQTINLREGTPSETPIVDNTDEPMFTFPPTFTRAWHEKNGALKPAGLQLQVPERVGGTVRLATPPPPPPTVLINGGAEQLPNSPNHSTSDQSQHAPTCSAEYDIMEYLSTRREENHQSANHLASQAQEFSTLGQTSTTCETPNAGINFSFKEEPGADRTNIDDLESHFRLRILSAEWSDINGTPCESCSIECADLIVKQTIRNLREDSSTPEAFLINLAALAGGRTLMTKLKMKVVKVEIIGEGAERKKRTIFESRWTLKFGAVEGSFTIQQTCKEKMPASDVTDDNVNTADEQISGEVGDDGNDEVDAKTWKKRYMELQDRFYKKDDRVWGIRKKVLDVLATTASDHVV